MNKIIIIGSPGAGKSVFSRKLREVTKIPLYHIDMLYHNWDGSHISREEIELKSQLRSSVLAIILFLLITTLISGAISSSVFA